MSDEKNLFQFRNCKFAFRCNADWFELDETQDEKIRFCNDCQRQVHLCDTEEKLTNAIKSNLCVAIEPPYQNNAPKFYIGSVARAVKKEP